MYDVLTDEAAKTLGLQHSENADNTFVVVVSRDCDPVSDSAITVAEREMLKQWRLEHMSLQDCEWRSKSARMWRLNPSRARPRPKSARNGARRRAAYLPGNTTWPSGTAVTLFCGEPSISLSE